MPAYETVTEALIDLKQRGYTRDFNLTFDHLKCSATDLKLMPSDFEIVEHYRFEGDSNPSDEDVVYAIESPSSNVKGTLFSAYGMYSEEVSDDLLKKLAVHR